MSFFDRGIQAAPAARAEQSADKSANASRVSQNLSASKKKTIKTMKRSSKNCGIECGFDLNVCEDFWAQARFFAECWSAVFGLPLSHPSCRKKETPTKKGAGLREGGGARNDGPERTKRS